MSGPVVLFGASGFDQVTVVEVFGDVVEGLQRPGVADAGVVEACHAGSVAEAGLRVGLGGLVVGVVVDVRGGDGFVPALPAGGVWWWRAEQVGYPTGGWQCRVCRVAAG